MVIPQTCFVTIGRSRSRERGFTLIELLVMISIVMLILAMLVPSLGGARAQSKSAHCLARLKDLGWATATYADSYDGYLPPAEVDARQHPSTSRHLEEENIYVRYGWAELLYEHVLRSASVDDLARYPVQRNRDNRYPNFATCQAGTPQADHAGHYRVYLPGWSARSYGLETDGSMETPPNPFQPAKLSYLTGDLVLMGDSEERSEAGDDIPPLTPGEECNPSVNHGRGEESSYISPTHWSCDDEGDVSLINQANQTVSRVHRRFVPNRFSDRHRGGTNYLFTDFHAERSQTLRARLGCDYDLNSVTDAGPCAAEPGGCDEPAPPAPTSGRCVGLGGYD